MANKETWQKVLLNNLGNLEISEFCNAGLKHLLLVLFIAEAAAAALLGLEAKRRMKNVTSESKKRAY